MTVHAHKMLHAFFTWIFRTNRNSNYFLSINLLFSIFTFHIEWILVFSFYNNVRSCDETFIILKFRMYTRCKWKFIFLLSFSVWMTLSVWKLYTLINLMNFRYLYEYSYLHIKFSWNILCMSVAACSFWIL